MSNLDRLYEEAREEAAKEVIFIGASNRRVDTRGMARIVFSTDLRNALSDIETEAYEDGEWLSVEFVGSPRSNPEAEYFYMTAKAARAYAKRAADPALRRKLQAAARRAEASAK